jgi:hypothetical protein
MNRTQSSMQIAVGLFALSLTLPVFAGAIRGGSTQGVSNSSLSHSSSGAPQTLANLIEPPYDVAVAKTEMQRWLGNHAYDLRRLRDSAKYDLSEVLRMKSAFLNKIPSRSVTKNPKQFKFFFPPSASRSVMTGRFILGADAENNQILVVDSVTGNTSIFPADEVRYIGTSKAGELIVFRDNGRNEELYVDGVKDTINFDFGDMSGISAYWKSLTSGKYVLEKNSSPGKNGIELAVAHRGELLNNLLVARSMLGFRQDVGMGNPFAYLGLNDRPAIAAAVPAPIASLSPR